MNRSFDMIADRGLYSGCFWRNSFKLLRLDVETNKGMLEASQTKLADGEPIRRRRQ
jgi:hypothetical protein